MWRDYTKYSKIKKKDASLASTVWFLSTITWNACIFEIRAYYKLFVACQRAEQVWIQVGWAFSIFRQSRYHGLTLSWVQGCSRSSGLGGLMLELRLITKFVDQCLIVLLLFIIVFFKPGHHSQLRLDRDCHLVYSDKFSSPSPKRRPPHSPQSSHWEHGSRHRLFHAMCTLSIHRKYYGSHPSHSNFKVLLFSCHISNHQWLIKYVMSQ